MTTPTTSSPITYGDAHDDNDPPSAPKPITRLGGFLMSKDYQGT
jgi:hypothetical protein